MILGFEITFAKEDMILSLFVSSLHKNFWTDLHQISQKVGMAIRTN